MKKILILISLFCCLPAGAQEIVAHYSALSNQDLSAPDPQANLWDDVAKTTVILLPQVVTPPSRVQTTVQKLNVQAIHNNVWLALRLTWDDPTQDFQMQSHHASDACAIQFPVREFDKTSPFMGTKDYGVAIYYWKAAWQKDVEAGFQGIKELYPHTWVDSYEFGEEIALNAHNPVSLQKRRRPVEDLIAAGFGTLTTQQQQNAEGSGVWQEGSWSVVIARQLATGDEQDPQLSVGTKTGLSFAIWEGSQGDVGGRKNYSMWVPLTVKAN